LAHSEEIWPRKPAQPWLRAGKVGRQLIDDALAPGRGRELVADVGPYLPIKLYQAGIHGAKSVLPRSLD
jgi:hypothetical protein